VSQVAESADLVHNTAQSVSQAAQESGSASREIAGGSEQLAVNSTEAAKIIDGLAKQSNDVSDGCATQLNLVGQVDQSLNEAASGVTDLASNAQHMSAMATEGNQAVREAVNAMNSVREKVLFSAQKVRELDQKGQQIGAIVATIDQIAEQTNLLALNAAIEAARAGEHGRGFAIVAEEVRKLAEQSSASTHEIAELIQSIRQTVHESVKAIEITATDSEAGADRSSRAGQILADVQTAANSVSSQAERLTILTHEAANSMREVAVATRSNAESAKAMVKGTNLVANTIMEVASFSEQSAAGAQELTAAVSEVGQSARKLDELGIELQSAVSKFQLELQPKGKKLRLAS
jgi:methyl-accepting chemotaxis protein